MNKECIITISEMYSGIGFSPQVCDGSVVVSWAIACLTAIGIIGFILGVVYLSCKLIEGIWNLIQDTIDERVQEGIEHHEDYCKGHKVKR